MNDLYLEVIRRMREQPSDPVPDPRKVFPYISPKILELLKMMSYDIGLHGTPEEAASLRGINYAVDLMTPKKPEFVDTRFCNNGPHISDGVTLKKCFKCPTCCSHIFYSWPDHKHCPHCGQYLDWSVVDQVDNSIVVELPIRLTLDDFYLMEDYAKDGGGQVPAPFAPEEIGKYVEHLRPYLYRYWDEKVSSEDDGSEEEFLERLREALKPYYEVIARQEAQSSVPEEVSSDG